MSVRRGFTLIELLVVIAILGILGSIGFVNFQGAQQSTRDGNRKQALRQLASALEIYYQKNDSYINPAGNGGSDCTNDMANFYAAVAPFMANQDVPKDLSTNANYCYISVNNGRSFRLFAKLENLNDKDINITGCLTYNFTVFSQDLTPVCPP